MKGNWYNWTMDAYDTTGLCLYEDAVILVVDKPAGLPVLPDGWDKTRPYLIKLLEEKYQRLWVVHRLDKTTSGVMVFARTADAHRSLNMQFEGREVRKLYHAICTGDPRWDDYVARFPLRVNVGHSHRTVVDLRRGILAETRFHVLERMKGGGCLLEAVPGTGRTHQIRVHAYALKVPILGDVQYSAPGTDLISRPALHAFSLAFRHPVSGEMVAYTASYPQDFVSALEKMRAGL
jgi:RluA family pseudouridine synthase